MPRYCSHNCGAQVHPPRRVCAACDTARWVRIADACAPGSVSAAARRTGFSRMHVYRLRARWCNGLPRPPAPPQPRPETRTEMAQRLRREWLARYEAGERMIHIADAYAYTLEVVSKGIRRARRERDQQKAA